MYEYTHKAMSYAHSPKKLSYMLMLWAMLIYELCSCHELCPYHKLCLKYDQWPCHNRIIHPIRDDRRLKNWCFFGKGPNWGLFWTHWMLSKLSPPHVEDPAQYVHIPKRHSGIFRDHDRRIDSSWSHHLFRCRLCTITWSTKTRGVHFTPIQACTFPARKLRVGRGCDQPKMGPACFSLRPISVQQQRRAAPLLWTLLVQSNTWTSSFIVSFRTIYCVYQGKRKIHLFAKATRATPAGPFASNDGSIFAHQLKHSTSWSSKNITLSTKSSTVLVLCTPAWTLNCRSL